MTTFPPPPLVETWDSDVPGADFDTGLQWDVNLGASTGDFSDWAALITSEHNLRPKFMTFLAMLLQPLADARAVIASIPGLFDVDVAVGVQLDAVGLWVGVSRYLPAPLVGVYFSFGTDGVGFGQGTWKGPFDPTEGLIELPDDAYRILIKAKIAENQWDGTIPGGYATYALLFAGTANGVLIQDDGDMTMIIALTGPTPNAVTLALFRNGTLALKPAGVRLRLATLSVPDAPYFGFGVQNSSIAGFGSGAWATITAPS